MKSSIQLFVFTVLLLVALHVEADKLSDMSVLGRKLSAGISNTAASKATASPQTTATSLSGSVVQSNTPNSSNGADEYNDTFGKATGVSKTDGSSTHHDPTSMPIIRHH